MHGIEFAYVGMEIEVQMGSWYKYIKKFNGNDEESIRQMIPNERVYHWIEAEVPKFECPDKIIEETYYFRWWTFRKHIKETPKGRIITEFLPKVSWAGPFNSINAASGHHIAEARWLIQDRDLAKEYIFFWLKGEGDEKSYSSWIIFSVYQYALVLGDKGFAISLLPQLETYYERVKESNLAQCGLFWSDDDRDAMERSISGCGLRPTLNSYMFANAYALARIASWAKDATLQRKYEEIANQLKENILDFLWDEQGSFFKVIPQVSKDNVQNMKFEDIPPKHNVREAIGYIPWSFSIAQEENDVAWKYLMDERYFKAPCGPTTAERNHPSFMKPCESHECLWNGPSWPFATTQTLNGLIELLQGGRDRYIGKEDFLELLQTYSKSHYRQDEKKGMINWIDENLEPDTGQWLSRDILKEWNWRVDKGGVERGKDYNHSTFCDLVIRGICGVVIDEEEQLTVNPLIPEEKWDYFLLENLPYKGHKITIGVDKDGTRYNKGKGFFVEIDGELKVKEEEIRKVSIQLKREELDLPFSS